ncbi:MAG: hypothetical protein NTW07_00270, partial [candidate division Zixibacteria bacterium]|nr:hypothetical protein [candidate division Zixibacteria bacterium]
KEARQKLIQSVQKRTNYACAELRKASSTGAINPDVSLLHVLRELNLSIRAWGNQYSFCNCPDVFDNIDQRIDECLRNLIGTYSVSRTNADAQLARRLLGVHLIQDSKHTPILPLSE